MASTPVVAIARVGHELGLDDKGNMQYEWFEPGEEVKGMDSDVLDTLRANGSVGDAPATLPSVVAEKEALELRVAELEAQLEAAKNADPDPEKAQKDFLANQAKANADALKAVEPKSATPVKAPPK